LILHHLVRQEIVRCLQQTQGLGAMLHQYHSQYDEIIRKRGAFTFNDAQYLLTPRNRNGAGSISRQAGDPDRLYIDYRLDAKLDHWLLDEFQDTSDLQWETLDNLASEIIQDTGGDRSFFLVGDVKQAIHGWRGGNAWLFGELLNRYRGGIELKTLSASFRSTKPVLDFVNRVFSSLGGLDLPAETVKRWHGLWENHVSEVKKPGFAAWVEPLSGGECEPEEEDVAHSAAGLIRELDPVAKGLSVAVLLPTNADCTRMTDALRRDLAAQAIPVVNEGAAELADNPVAALMRSLLKVAGHPGDILALNHLRMSPLREQVQTAGDDLPLLLQRQIHSNGFADFFRFWAARLQEEIGPLDVFGAKRLHDLLAVAAESDASGNRDPDTLIATIDCHELREQTTGGAVRVMTIHQSKGLGFDAVIVPLLKNDSVRQVGQLDLTPGCTGANTWILKMPRQLVSKADPVLNERLEKITADISFGNLCVLYVALTRARQGLYVITKYGRKKRSGNRSLSEGIILAKQLLNTDKPEAEEGHLFTAGGVSMRCLAQEGDPEWIKATPATRPPAPSPAPAGPLFPALDDRGTRLKRVEPSRGDTEIRQANWLFKSESRGVLEFGTLIHELLAKVEWTETADPEAILGSWTSSKIVDENVRRDAEAQFRRLLAAPEVRSALGRPAGTVDLWREMRFELVDGGAWISGAFDRVIVFRDGAGNATRATLMDFKSSRITEEREMEEKASDYRHQLDLYRRALSVILKIPETSVDVRILFTRPARLYSL
jgi:ATP-dependent helicase/nuclease subunit A